MDFIIGFILSKTIFTLIAICVNSDTYTTKITTDNYIKDTASQYCSDIPTVTVDGIAKDPLNGGLYAFVESSYVRTDSISRNGQPIISDGYPQVIRRYWNQLPDNIDTAFEFNHMIYFLRFGKLWRHDPSLSSTTKIVLIDPEVEFPYLKGKQSLTDSILSVSTLPDPTFINNKLKDQLLIRYIGYRNDSQYLYSIRIRGNTTVSELSELKEMPVDGSTDFDLLFREYLVLDHWPLSDQTIVNSLWFMNKIYFNLIETLDKPSIELSIANAMNAKVRIRTMGYNQVWMGCPQPLCLDATVDTVIALNNKLRPLLVFRGSYSWMITGISSPRTEYARPISSEWNKLPSHLDASYYDSKTGQILFFKNDSYYKFVNKIWSQNKIEDIFPGIPTPFDAIFFLQDLQQFYIFKDDKYYIFDKTKNEMTRTGGINEFLDLPNYIDSAFATEDAVYVLKSWYYYKIDVKLFGGASENIIVNKTSDIFTDLFDCSEDIYLKADYQNLNYYLKSFEFATKPIAAKDDQKWPNDRPLPQTSSQDLADITSFVSTDLDDWEQQTEPNDLYNWSNGKRPNKYDNQGAPGLDSEAESSKSSSSGWLWLIAVLFVIIVIIIAFVAGFALFVGKPKTKEKVDKNDDSNDFNIKVSEKNAKSRPHHRGKAHKKGNIAVSKPPKEQEIQSFTFNEDEPNEDEILIKEIQKKAEAEAEMPVRRMSTETFSTSSNPSLTPTEKPEPDILF